MKPVEHATTIAHSVLRKTTPRSKKFSASREIVTPNNLCVTMGGKVLFPSNVGTEALESFEFRGLRQIVWCLQIYFGFIHSCLSSYNTDIGILRIIHLVFLVVEL